PRIHIQTRLVDDNYALISFIDNGPGISQDIMNRIFEPFFTTKPVGQGTGLGLSLSYQTITQYHNGSLECRSVPGESTSFVIKIPIRQKKDDSVLLLGS
ncbi:MAG: signal transduction histidine kinase regulating C4-dicarboxylate transporter, partial [Leptolyngbya sp. SIO3F4]|nr:signal transduction histidine kinase regulating C4-dicarboxylate transporter [Leptolyngbya sp. SIO3F4]